MPFIRRRWPMVHRGTGVSVVLLVAASMIGSLLVQASHPLATTLSGAGFGLGLTSLCGLTLVELALAVLAIRAGDYRSHMGWMALTFASLLTAPVLRVQWLLLGFTGLRMDEANLVIATYLVPQTILVMAFWMMSVGARDLGLDAPKSILPPTVLRGLAMIAAIVVVHEACLAPLGVDLLQAWRGSALLLPKSAILWGLATAALACRVPTDCLRLESGQLVRRATVYCAIAAAIGGLIVAWSLDGSGLQALAQRSFYAAGAVQIIVLVLLGRRAASPHATRWTMQWLYAALAPSLWPMVTLTFMPLGVGLPVAMTTAMADCFATITVLGFASAFGLRVVVASRRRSSGLSPLPT